MEYPTIQAQARTERGKGAARRARRDGRIPAVAYSAGSEAVSLSVNPKDLHLLHRGDLGWNAPFVLAVDGGEDLGLSMLKDVQRHPVSGALLHADFMRVADDVPVTVRLPLVLVGKSPGVELGGKLAQPLRSVRVQCLPALIPQRIEIDISTMQIGDKVLLSSLPTPEGVTLAYRQDATVVNIVRGRGAGAAVVNAEGEEAEEAEE